MNPYIYIQDNVLSKEICKEIIEKFEKQPNKFKGVTGSGYKKDTKHTLDYSIPENIKEDPDYELWKDIRNLLIEETKNHIFKYKSIIETSINNTFNSKTYPAFSSSGILMFNTFLMHKYTANEGQYRVHTDNFIENNKNRIFTYLYYINDVYEGGETKIFPDIMITPKAGRLLLFPASWTYPHQGCMPISNDKYIITGWVYV